MAFVRKSGKTKIMYFNGDTAKEVRNGSLVMLSDSGTVIRLDNDSSDRPIGVARRNDTAAASKPDKVPVEVPVENAVEWFIDVDSDGGAADSDIGMYCSIDTLGGGSVLAGDSVSMRVDVSDTSVRQIFITGRVSATKIIGTIANTAWDKGTGDSAFG